MKGSPAISMPAAMRAALPAVMRAALAVLLTMALLGGGDATAAQVIDGQVVCCRDCWAEKDRRKVEYGSTADLRAAAACIAGGDPTLLAVPAGDGFELYRLELGAYRLPGKDWLELVGSQVRVRGETSGSGKEKIIRVDALEVTRPSMAARQADAAVGSKAELTLRDLSGAPQALASFAGRVVVLNFWATYCAPCRKEMPDLTAIQNDYAALGVQVIGATAETTADKAAILAFVREAKVNFPVWVGTTTADMERFGLTGSLPATVVIDKQGKVAKVIAGTISAPDLRKEIDALLAASDAAADAGLEEDVGDGEETADSAEASSVPS